MHDHPDFKEILGGLPLCICLGIFDISPVALQPVCELPHEHLALSFWHQVEGPPSAARRGIQPGRGCPRQVFHVCQRHDEVFFPRSGTRSRSAACATPTAPSSASSRAASAAASEISSDLRPSRPRHASASDSTPSIRRLGRAKLPRALVLRLLRLGPVRRAARGVPEPAQGPGDGPARTRSRVLGFEHSERRVVFRRSRSTSRRCSGPRLPAHGAHSGSRRHSQVDVNDMETLRARARRRPRPSSENVF